MYLKKVFIIAIIRTLIISICFLIVNNRILLAGDILDHGKKLYSQYDEELIIRDFFNDRKNGIFVDVGCWHYKNDSTTYYLEKHLGWSGIAIDALIEIGADYVENRPKTRFFNFIVTDHSGSIEQFYRAVNATGVSSTSKKWVNGITKYLNIKKEFQVLYIPTITLTEILNENGIYKIDFLSMDIEGGEMAALKGFDIEKFKPELICIEASWHKDEILAYFSRHNYERINKYLNYDKHNWYFKPKTNSNARNIN